MTDTQNVVEYNIWIPLPTARGNMLATLVTGHSQPSETKPRRTTSRKLERQRVLQESGVWDQRKSQGSAGQRVLVQPRNPAVLCCLARIQESISYSGRMIASPSQQGGPRDTARGTLFVFLAPIAAKRDLECGISVSGAAIK